MILANRRHSSPSALYEEAAFTFPTKAPSSPQTTRPSRGPTRDSTGRTRSKSGPSLCGRVPAKVIDFNVSGGYESYPETPKSVDSDPKSPKDACSLYSSGEFTPSMQATSTRSAFTPVRDFDIEKVPVLKLDSPPKMKKRDSKRRESTAEVVVSSANTGDHRSDSTLTVADNPSIDRQYRHSDTVISTVGVTVTPATSPLSNSPSEGFKGFWRELSNESASSRDSSTCSYKHDGTGTPTRERHSFEQSITVKRKPGGRYETVFDAVLSPSPPMVSPRNSPRTSPLTPPRSPGRRSPQTPKSPIVRFIPGKDKNPRCGDRTDRKSSDFGRTSPLEALRSPSFNRSPNSSPPSPAPGVVVTSHRSSRRRSSISSAAIAFAAATAGASVSPAASPTSASRFRFGFNFQFSECMDGHIVTMRVLKILKHWICKQIEVCFSISSFPLIFLYNSGIKFDFLRVESL